MEEKFSLKWNDYQENIIKTFSLLRKEEEFFDVTLVSDDQKRIMAHKVVLSSSSEYFRNILKTNKHSHPMLCLTGICSEDLENVLNYIYQGEVQIFQRDIDKFLDIAQRLGLQGLLTLDKENDEKHYEYLPKQPMETESKLEPRHTLEKSDVNWDSGVPERYAVPMSSSTVDEIEQKITECLGKNENGDYICNLCGKVSGKYKTHIKNHIETHLEGISFSCSICEKQFRSRNSLKSHTTLYHKIKITNNLFL